MSGRWRQRAAVRAASCQALGSTLTLLPRCSACPPNAACATPRSVGVTSEPQHVQLELTPADQLLLLASDGVWEFIASDEALALVAAHASAEDGCRAVRRGADACTLGACMRAAAAASCVC